jgi:hypothetical protein
VNIPTGQKITTTTIAEPAEHRTLAQLVAIFQRDGIPILEVRPDHGERGGIVVGYTEQET